MHKAFEQVNQGLALSPTKVTTLQDNLDQLIPGQHHYYLHSYVCGY